MKTYTNLKQIKVGELFFAIRDETSDIKAIKEVVVNQSYKRKDFKPEAGENWIDIGANCGAFCVWAASLGAQVIAFEPDPGNYEICSANIGMNKMQSMIKLFDAGLTESDSASVAILHRNTAKGNLWRNSLYKKWRGGESVKVKINPVHKYWNSKNCIKLDAEGVEMPILEKYAKIKVKKLVFEWSFDIDPSLARFEKVIETLKTTYDNVIFSGYQAGHKNWQASWFPACRTVWCY
jgi:FkbM family methyltransferase